VLKFTRINSDTLACKRFWLEANSDGVTVLQKETAAAISGGEVEIVECRGLREFIELREDAGFYECFTYGTPNNGRPRQFLTCKGRERPNSVARTRNAFSFSKKQAVFMIDIDQDEADKERALYGHLECDELIGRCFEPWQDCQRVWVPSSSAFLKGFRDIGGPTSDVFRDIGGWRAYAIIDRGNRIPDLTRHLHYQLWTIDEGRIVLGKAGQRRDISLIDRIVSTPEHIDFVAGPKLEQRDEVSLSLERYAPPPCFLGPEKATLRTKELGKVPSYQDWKRSYELLQRAWKALEPESRKQSRKAAASLDISEPTMWKAVEYGVLDSDFLVTTDLGKVSVRGILANPVLYDGMLVPDPLEPSYDGGRKVGIIYTDGKPQIWSFARGGRSFRLLADNVSFEEPYE
jgi:hypothetical protein